MNQQNENALSLGRVAPMIAVTDIGSAKSFYKAAFGLEPVFENGNPVGFCILKKDAAELHLTLQRDWKGQTFNVAHILVKDADAIYVQVQKAGARIIKRLQVKDYGLTAFVFEDPFGNRIDVGAPNP
ncbi:MAG: VOC family protein [Paracoccaceae bacterium]